jgi:hypothetical protein
MLQKGLYNLSTFSEAPSTMNGILKSALFHCHAVCWHTEYLNAITSIFSLNVENL